MTKPLNRLSFNRCLFKWKTIPMVTIDQSTIKKQLHELQGTGKVMWANNSGMRYIWLTRLALDKACCCLVQNHLWVSIFRSKYNVPPNFLDMVSK
ncbi:hypothetical protein RJT34_25191 [Clitoria ternatea]|uniref:Uncharacterized protein n=1 Tax=Clitoria ternatea TaxID=43366 RepID=A0AAN9FRE1_CLITE